MRARADLRRRASGASSRSCPAPVSLRTGARRASARRWPRRVAPRRSGVRTPNSAPIISSRRSNNGLSERTWSNDARARSRSPSDTAFVPLVEEVVDLGRDAGGRARRRALAPCAPAPVARRTLADHVLVGVPELPVPGVAEQRDRLPRGPAHLSPLRTRERDDDTRGVGITRSPVRSQHVGEHLMVGGLHRLARDGLADGAELATGPARDLFGLMSASLDQTRDRLVTQSGRARAACRRARPRRSARRSRPDRAPPSTVPMRSSMRLSATTRVTAAQGGQLRTRTARAWRGSPEFRPCPLAVGARLVPDVVPGVASRSEQRALHRLRDPPFPRACSGESGALGPDAVSTSEDFADRGVTDARIRVGDFCRTLVELVEILGFWRQELDWRAFGSSGKRLATAAAGPPADALGAAPASARAIGIPTLPTRRTNQKPSTAL